MKFKKDDYQFLKGERFSNGYKIEIGKKQDLRDRISLIRKAVKNKTVLHFGCVDHLPLIEDKIKNGFWLHELITRDSAECIGIDNNLEGIEYLQKSLGFTNVIGIDLIADEVPDSIKIKKWDYIIMGEIVEHLDNPVLFLKSIKEKVNCDKIIVTVPNAFNYNNLKNIFKNTELINTDHRFWFTPYTISKVLIEAGFHVDSFQFCNGYPFGKSKRLNLRRYLLKRYPALNSTLLVIADF
jgi:hypothetical protein